MAERISALAGEYNPGRFGVAGEIGVIFREAPNPVLFQVAAWPDTIAAAGARAAEAVGAGEAPGPGRAMVGAAGAVLRIEPLKFWILGTGAPQFDAADGVTLDLSHSRTLVRLSGPQASTLLNRHLPLDLRDMSFPVGSVASSAFDHAGVTLWRSEAGFELFLPRGFALSLWQVLLQGAAQFGYQVIDKKTCQD